MTRPPDIVVQHALELASQSPCRSRRGVVVWATSCGVPIVEGGGYNGPPRGAPCPGRAVCAGTCGQRCVHAEIRAIRRAGWPRHGGPSELVHVERAVDGGVKPCLGPSCWQCAREILDVGFIAGVWLYEDAQPTLCGAYLGDNDATCPQLTCIRQLHHDGNCDNVTGDPPLAPAWRRYTAEEFYRTTLLRCGMTP